MRMHAVEPSRAKFIISSRRHPTTPSRPRRQPSVMDLFAAFAAIGALTAHLLALALGAVILLSPKHAGGLVKILPGVFAGAYAFVNTAAVKFPSGSSCSGVFGTTYLQVNPGCMLINLLKGVAPFTPVEGASVPSSLAEFAGSAASCMPRLVTMPAADPRWTPPPPLPPHTPLNPSKMHSPRPHQTAPPPRTPQNPGFLTAAVSKPPQMT
eukprot:SAG22_NODE_1428_length_4445_cov_1.417663_5_plen_209_part_01